MYHEEILKKLLGKCKEDSFFKNKIEQELKICKKYKDTGERQFGKRLSNIKADHIHRYRLARNFLSAGDNVLDIACGCGYGSKVMADKKRARVLAIDGSAAAIKHAKRYYKSKNIVYQQEPVNCINFYETKFDKIVCFETLEHIENDTLFLNQIVKTLKPGGLLILSTPNKKYNPLNKHQFHVRHYFEEELISTLKTNNQDIHVRVLYQTLDNIHINEQNSRFLVLLILKPPHDPADISNLDMKLSNLLPFAGERILFRKTADYIYHNHPALFKLVHPLYLKMKKL